LNQIQDLYHNELRLYKNFFQPVMRLESKERVEGRRKRRYARAQTPYRILQSSGQIAPDKLRELDALYRDLNPADLKRRIDRKLKKLCALYEKKKKGSLRVNPYQDTDPPSVTWLYELTRKRKEGIRFTNGGPIGTRGGCIRTWDQPGSTAAPVISAS
jgi:hypothetical protein